MEGISQANCRKLSDVQPGTKVGRFLSKYQSFNELLFEMKNFHLKEQFFLSFFLSFFLRFCLNIELVEFNLARNVKIIAATSNSKVSSLTSLSRRGNSNSKCQRQSYTHGPRFSLLSLSLSLSLSFFISDYSSKGKKEKRRD